MHDRERRWATVLVCIFAGCGINAVLLEQLVKENPGCVSLVTFAQFVFVTLVGLKDNVEWTAGATVPRLATRHIPLTSWLLVVLLFFSSSVLNNMSLDYGVSVPMQIVIRSGTLPMNILLGFLLANKRYTWRHLFSVALITVGVTLFSITSAPSSSTMSASINQRFVMGVSLQLFALVLSGLLGLQQERVYRRHGEHPLEGMFYVHMLSLPLFLLQAAEILRCIVHFNMAPIVTHFVVPIPSVLQMPRPWFLLLLNVLTQYVCISGVYMLTSMTSSLSVQVVLSVRKTMSLVFSIFYFGNPFSLQQAVYTAFVFGGTLLYSRASAGSNPPQQPSVKKED